MFNSNKILFPRDSLHLIFLVVTGDVILLNVQVSCVTRLGGALCSSSVTSDPGFVFVGGAPVQRGAVRGGPSRRAGGRCAPTRPGRGRQVWHGHYRHDPRVTHSVTADHCRLRLETEDTDLADVSVTVTHPDVLQVVGVEADGGSRAGELEPGPGLADWDEREQVWRRGSSAVLQLLLRLHEGVLPLPLPLRSVKCNVERLQPVAGVDVQLEERRVTHLRGLSLRHLKRFAANLFQTSFSTLTCLVRFPSRDFTDSSNSLCGHRSLAA